MPILVSLPIPLRTILTSAPTSSHRLAISFMKLMRVASIELAAYLIISAEGISVKIRRSLTIMKGLYNRAMSLRARSLSTPTTTRSGLMKSLTALPSLRNSGLLATSKLISTPRAFNSSSITAFTLPAVPTGTVLLVTTTM